MVTLKTKNIRKEASVKLDELDVKHYAPQENQSGVKKANKMSIPANQAGDDNTSDFDNSDEDLASLLADDDDDIFANKTFSGSTSKVTSDQNTVSSPKKSEGIPKSDSKILKGDPSVTSSKKTFEKSSSKENDDDALQDFLNKSSLPSFLSDSKKVSPIKRSANKISEDSRKESVFFSDLGLNSKNVTLKNQTDKTLKSNFSLSDDEDDDILKSLESDDKVSGTPHKQRSGSVFDDFLKSLSPKNSPKKSVSEAVDDVKGDDSEEDDLLKSLESDEKDLTSLSKQDGSFFDDFLKNISPKQSPKKSAKVGAKVEKSRDSYRKGSVDEDISGKFSASPKKSNSPVKKNSSVETKRENLQKQVSFKDILEKSPEKTLKEKENHMKEPSSHLTSTHLDNTVSDTKTINKATSQPRRSEKMGATSKDETDWLNFFKESPKKSPKLKDTSLKQKIISDEMQSPSKDSQFNNNRRRSSSADWLGLSDSKSVSKGDVQISKASKIPVKTEDEWLTEKDQIKVSRPHTSPSKKQDSLEFSVENKIPMEMEDEWQAEKDLIRESRPRTTPGRRRQDNSQTIDMHWLSDDSDTARKNKGILASPGISREFALSSEVNATDLNIKKAVKETQNFQVAESREVPPSLHFEKKEVDLQYYPPDSQAIQKPLKTNYAHQNVSKDSGTGSEFRSDANSNSHALQTVINNHIFEKDQLLKSFEAMKLMYEERIKSLEILHKDQLKTSEESFKSIETKLKLEIEAKIRALEDKLNNVELEKKLLEQNFKIKQEDTEKENLKEIQRLKDLHCQSISLIKQDHEEALQRLKRLKEQEVDAVLSTQAHSRSLQYLTEQLEARTAEMASLQMKLEERNQATMREKQALLDVKERDLKSLQNRLQRQLDNSDDERERLQQLVLKLESRLQKYATEGEEDRWEVQQLKARLSVQQKHLDEEYKFQMQQLEKEKDKLRLSQDSLLHEQKTVLIQLAQERQQLMQEKVDFELLAKRNKEDEAKLHVKVLKEESFIEKQKQYIQQEQSKIYFERSNVKQELELLEKEKEVLETEKQMLKDERLKMNELNFKLRRKENELEILAVSAAEEKERGQMEHQAALKIKADQQLREQQINKKMQELMEKEHNILSDKEKLTEEKFELERKKNSVLCNKCKLSLGHPVNAPPMSIGQPTVNSSNAAHMGASPFLNGISNTLVPSHLDPSLVVWYITAQKDREFLQEELSFLRSLKESSKNYKK
ncbi:fas-binding factor 1 [Nephila pilipes]|uniref:Fas-binding factor 1 n=1 Tax=Nephila pilipes TaxID=299642 RepID=A0A8X6PAP9_NEPPI|nr:fas-binding factor 1 [Nephila pilipes]